MIYCVWNFCVINDTPLLSAAINDDDRWTPMDTYDCTWDNKKYGYKTVARNGRRASWKKVVIHRCTYFMKRRQLALVVNVVTFTGTPSESSMFTSLWSSPISLIVSNGCWCCRLDCDWLTPRALLILFFSWRHSILISRHLIHWSSSSCDIIPTEYRLERFYEAKLLTAFFVSACFHAFVSPSWWSFFRG